MSGIAKLRGSNSLSLGGGNSRLTVREHWAKPLTGGRGELRFAGRSAGLLTECDLKPQSPCEVGVTGARGEPTRELGCHSRQGKGAE